MKDRAIVLKLPDLEEHEIFAVRALYRGEANQEQQIMAFDVIVKKFGNIGGMSYAGEATHDSAFMEGRRWLAFSLMRLITEQTAKLVFKPRKKEKPND